MSYEEINEVFFPGVRRAQPTFCRNCEKDFVLNFDGRHTEANSVLVDDAVLVRDLYASNNDPSCMCTECALDAMLPTDKYETQALLSNIALHALETNPATGAAGWGIHEFIEEKLINLILGQLRRAA